MFRLAQHDSHCRMADKTIASGDRTHNVNRNADNGVNICFACHNAKLNVGDTLWAVDWTVASPATSCIACHEHQPGQGPAPAVSCK